MATVNLLKNGSHKSCDDLRRVLDYVKREAKTTHEGKKLVTGIICPAETAYTNMMLTKNLHKKTGGRMYYHLCQSFSPDEKITPELAHKVGVELAEKLFPGYEIVVGTHVDREHIHSHIVFNSVNCETGKMYHSDNKDIQRWRDASDEICLKYGLSVVTNDPNKDFKRPGAREFRAIDKNNSWKMQLVLLIELAMKRAKTREEFIKFMEEHGYKVTWTDTRKYITYTTPDEHKCRDNKLHESKFLKEAMQNEFRIRAEILRGKRKLEEQYRSRIEGNTMCDDNGTELECDGKSSQIDGRDDGAHGNDRGDVRLHESIDDHILQQGRVAGDEGQIYCDGTSGEDGTDQERLRETGWEAERRICFSAGNITEDVGSGFQDIYGQDVQMVPDSVATIDIAVGSARLASNLGKLIEPEEQPLPSKPAHMDKKEWQKIAEKKEALGIKMGGM